MGYCVGEAAPTASTPLHRPLGGTMQEQHSEEWRPVPGYEGHYEVSDLGRVQSLPRRCVAPWGGTRLVPGKLLSQSAVTGGYRAVCLSKDGRYKTRMVHQLVLFAFVGPRPGKGREYDSCHNDGDKANNQLANLRWDTKKANSQDRCAHGTMFQGETHPATSLLDEQVTRLRQRHAAGEHIRHLAAEVGMSYSGMSKVIRGESFSHLPVLGKGRHGNCRG